MSVRVILLAASLLMSAATQANLVVNGSFETVSNPSPGTYLQISKAPPNPYPLNLCDCLTGWEIVGNGVEWIHTSNLGIGNAADGSHYLDLTLWADIGAEIAGIKQDLSTVIGQTYNLTFYATSAKAHGRNGTGQVLVEAAGTSQTFELLNDAAALDWVEYSLNFTAIATTTTLRFTNTQNEYMHFSFIDNVVVSEAGPSTQAVQIDIKPGSDPNSINLCSGGAVPIAIFGSGAFDVNDILTETLRFAEAAVKVVGRKDPNQLCSYEDVNGDYNLDLVCHFVTQDIAGIDGESTSASLNGELLDETPIEGADSVNIVKDTCN